MAGVGGGAMASLLVLVLVMVLVIGRGCCDALSPARGVSGPASAPGGTSRDLRGCSCQAGQYKDTSKTQGRCPFSCEECKLGQYSLDGGDEYCTTPPAGHYAKPDVPRDKVFACDPGRRRGAALEGADAAWRVLGRCVRRYIGQQRPMVASVSAPFGRWPSPVVALAGRVSHGKRAAPTVWSRPPPREPQGRSRP